MRVWKCLWAVGCLHLARATILARVAGLRESVIAFWRLETRGCGSVLHHTITDGDLENRFWEFSREFGSGGFHKYCLRLVGFAWETASLSA
jgi:hypothetical protein